ncbi:hypothetical protein DFH09DRAFT_1296669 [Mycena vulgaris]|nr:hypothetical protein DFH09DRAFT_1296669 [Mycena vulgaris]
MARNARSAWDARRSSQSRVRLEFTSRASNPHHRTRPSARCPARSRTTAVRSVNAHHIESRRQTSKFVPDIPTVPPPHRVRQSHTGVAAQICMGCVRLSAMTPPASLRWHNEGNFLDTFSTGSTFPGFSQMMEVGRSNSSETKRETADQCPEVPAACSSLLRPSSNALVHDDKSKHCQTGSIPFRYPESRT